MSANVNIGDVSLFSLGGKYGDHVVSYRKMKCCENHPKDLFKEDYRPLNHKYRCESLCMYLNA